jgi:hypothetical protein
MLEVVLVYPAWYAFGVTDLLCCWQVGVRVEVRKEGVGGEFWWRYPR